MTKESQQHQLSWNMQGRLYIPDFPLIMGILNLSQDSFYAPSRKSLESQIFEQVESMLMDGADIIDVGAVSSRPNAPEVSEQDEEQMLIPVLEQLTKRYEKAIFSVDTCRANIARLSLETGAHMINDISSGEREPHILDIVAKYKVPYVAMHMRGNATTMQEAINTTYEALIPDILKYFVHKLTQCKEKGIHDIIIDPGFGFSKTLNQNYELLKQLHLFNLLEKPILVGVSRKSMIQKIIHAPAEESLHGTTAVHMYALSQGAAILRVHDVKAAKDCIQIYKKITE